MNEDYFIDQAIHREDLRGTRAEPTYSGVLSFMRRKYTRNLEGVDVAVTGIPLDTATSKPAPVQGLARAPSARLPAN